MLIRCVTGCLLALLLIADFIPGFAQYRKAPPTGLSSRPVNPPYQALLAAGYRSYRQVELLSRYGESLDSSELRDFTFDAKGRLQESTNYEFVSRSTRLEQQRSGGPVTRFREGSRIRYDYDAAGNVISMKQLDVVFGGSDDALLAALAARFSNGQSRFNDDDDDDPGRKAAIQRFIDSFRAVPQPDVWLLRKETRYAYDRDGNLLYEEDSAERRIMSYTYTYDEQGRVTRQRGIYRVREAGRNLAYYSGEETHFTYAGGENPASIRMYIGERDTGTLALDEYLRAHQEIHYNRNGDADTTTHRHGTAAVRHVAAFEGRLRTAYTILNESPARQRSDTVSYTLYRYRDTSLSETRSWHFVAGRRADSVRETYEYDKQNLLTLHRTIRGEFTASPAVTLSLYFYGDKAGDAATAARYREEARAVDERRAAGEKRGREAAAEREAARKRQPPTSPKPAPVVPVQTAEDPVFKFVEQMPRFDGDLNAFISANLRYPPAARKDSIEGRSVLQFVVRRDGSVTDAAIVREAGHGFDEAALDLARRMPKWIPGRQQGRSVSVFFTIPITFRLRVDTAGAGTARNMPVPVRREASVEEKPVSPEVPPTEHILRYENNVVAIKGVWAYADPRGAAEIRSMMDRKSRANRDEHPDRSNYFFVMTKPYILFEGLLQTWYPNGNLERAVNYERGVENGRFERWYYFGNREVVGNFYKGIAVGRWNFYHPNGKLAMTAHYDTATRPQSQWGNTEIPGPKTERARMLYSTAVYGFSNALSWLGRQNKPHGPVYLFDDNGDTSMVLRFVHGRRDGAWDARERGRQKVRILYRDDSVVAFYDRRGHDVATDRRYRQHSDFERLFYKESGIDSSGAEPVYPGGYYAQDTLFQEARFPGEAGAFEKYIAANLRFPAENLQVAKEGSVGIDCVVRSDGALSDIRVYSGLGYGCDEEALRLVRAMPRWEPARDKGRAVAMRKFIVIPFKKP